MSSSYNSKRSFIGTKLKISVQELPITDNNMRNKPEDKYGLIYLSFIFQGAALLFPFNTFVFLVDFYQERFCELHLLYWAMISVILCASLCFAFITTLIADRVSISTRLLTGHILFIIALILFLLFTILTALGVFDSLPLYIGYAPLIVGFITGIGSGITQTSYYGLSSLFPSRYTQALVVGETVSSLVIACFRVGTRLLKPSGSCSNYDTIIFISLTLLVMLASVGVLKFIYWHDYTKYWLKIVKDNFLIEYSVLEQQGADSFEDEDESVISGRNETLISEESPLSRSRRLELSSVRKYILLFKLTIKKKAIIFKRTWQLQLTILFTMLLTLFLFPTFLTAAYACEPQLCDWGPIITLCVFELFDFITRWFTLIPVKCSNLRIFLLSLPRFVFIPLFAIFIFPVSYPIVPFKIGFPIFLIVVAAFGVTNGYFVSVPLVLIPKNLKANDKESGGTIGIFMLFIGLAAGSLLAYPFNETILTRPSNMTSVCCLSHIQNTTWNQLINNNATQLGVCSCAI